MTIIFTREDDQISKDFDISGLFEKPTFYNC